MNNPTLHSHTHCQVAQKANRTTKTCQRVCLSQRTADRNEVANLKKNDRKNKHRTANNVYKTFGSQCVIERHSSYQK